MAQLNMDMTNVDPTPRFDPIPAGEYPVIITESELKYTKDSSGQYLELTLEIQGGEYQGRKLFDRLNLFNNNSKAVEIAQRQLAQICHAVGVLQVADSEQLHFKPLVAIVKVRPAANGFDASNEIKGYKPAAGAPVQTTHQRQASQPVAPAATSRPRAPWEKAA